MAGALFRKSSTKEFNVKKSIAILILGVTLSAPALAQKQTLEAAAAPLLDVSQCEKPYIARIGKVEAQVLNGQHYVLIHPAASMTAGGNDADVHEPFAVGPLNKAASAVELKALGGKLICNEPF